MNNTDYKAIVIGTSTGGLDALSKILPKLPGSFPIPIIVVQHLHPHSSDNLRDYFEKKCALKIKEADEKEQIARGYVYTAPANYHLLIEEDETFALSINGKVNYCRPSIDVLFESAAEVYQSKLIGIILTGANNDGAVGLKKVKQSGGLVIVQNPDGAVSNTMPRSALAVCKADYVLSLKEITNFMKEISTSKIH